MKSSRFTDMTTIKAMILRNKDIVAKVTSLLSTSFLIFGYVKEGNCCIIQVKM